MNIKQHNIESVRDFIGGIRVIKVKNKQETLRAMDALEKLGLSTFAPDSRKKFEDTGDNVTNNFMIKEDDGGWRIQSHYLGNGFPAIELEILTEAYGRIISTEVVEFEKLKKDISTMSAKGETIPQDIYFRYNELTKNNK